jgi:3-deoxy-D-manno-octulosonic acid (KDO) 8-phosphate synthase
MQQKKIVRVGDIECGAYELFLISGPCVIEDEKIMMKDGIVVAFTANSNKTPKFLH